MSRSTPRAATAILLSLCAGDAVVSADPGPKVALRRLFLGQQVNYYVIEHDETARQMFFLLPAPMVITRRCTDALIERVTQVHRDGSAAIEWKLDRVQYQKSDQQGDFRFDSASSLLAGPDAAPAAALVGAVLRVQQKPHGTLEPPAPASSAASSAPSTSSRPAVPPVARATPPRGPGGYYDAADFPHTLARMTTEFLPPMPVAVGESWRMCYEELKPAFGTLIHHLRYTLKSIEGAADARIAVIAIDGSCTVEPLPGTDPKGKSKVHVELKMARWSGEIRFEIDKGRVASATLRHENDISSEMSGGDSGMTITLGLGEDRTIRLRRVDQLPPKPILVQATRPGTPPPLPPNGGSRAIRRDAARLHPASRPSPPRPVPPPRRPPAATQPHRPGAGARK